MLDHIGLVVSNVERARVFFDAALAPLGMSRLIDLPKEVTGHEPVYGYGAGGKPDFWISQGASPTAGLHVAFVAPTRADVDAFYAAAMKAGARDNGGPGLRPHYHPNYYGAFVFDFDGHNVEAVCHAPQ